MPQIQTGQRETRLLAAGRFEVRAAEDGKPPTLTGYASTFDEPFDVGGEWWGWTEVVAPGAFKRALSEKQDVRLLVNHDGLPLARTASGTLKLSEDRKGLAVEAELDADDPDVQALVPKMKRGDLDQMSIAFVVRDESWRYGKGHDRDLRTIKDVDLFDVSVVTYPANQKTSAQVRALAIETDLDLAAVLRVCARAERGADLGDEDHDLIRRAIDSLRGYLPATSDLRRASAFRQRLLDIEALA